MTYLIIPLEGLKAAKTHVHQQIRARNESRELLSESSGQSLQADVHQETQLHSQRASLMVRSLLSDSRMWHIIKHMI